MLHTAPATWLSSQPPYPHRLDTIP
jgi:hypothetical protein